ncbi:MAG: hypothetical protein HYS09_05075 [Chloroflexi bacterium]|nr:hypothetical protein [Chloroflexota bacterium]
MPVQAATSALVQFARRMTDWMHARSPVAEEALARIFAPNVRSSFYAGSGSEAVLQGLRRLLDRLGSDFYLMAGELEGRQVLLALRQDNGGWQRVGYFVVGVNGEGAVEYLDYRNRS